MDYTIRKDEEWRRREEEKNAKRRQNAINLMKESEENYAKRVAASVNGANRGQKMTAEELRLNKDLLKQVSVIKKEGRFDNLFEKCFDRKITRVE